MTQIIQSLKLNKAKGLSGLIAGTTLTSMLGAAAGLLLVTACASTPVPPTAELQAAEIAIANADQARVADYAVPELSEAREKLAAARIAVQKEDMVVAQRLAEQARVDAELALAKTNVAKAEAVNNEMKKSIDTLKQEMQRNTNTGETK